MNIILALYIHSNANKNTLPYVHLYCNVSYSGHFIVLPHGEQSQTHEVVLIRVCTSLASSP